MIRSRVAKSFRLVFLSVLLMLGAGVPHAWAMATERVGNAPLSPSNYRDWPGIVPIVNHKSRVYQIWVNGNEFFHYRSDTRTLNHALTEFAKVQTARRVVILRAGPAKAQGFDEKRIPYDWNLHLVGGIARAHAGEQADTSAVWDVYPTITIFIGGNIELEKLQIPKGITVLELADLRARFRRGLESHRKDDRGYAAYYLAKVDADCTESAVAVAKLLEDEDDWVRLMAAGALGRFGPRAASALPALKKGLEDDSERIRKRFKETIVKIEQAEDDPAAIQRRRTTTAEISTFVKALPAHARLPRPAASAPASRPASPHRND